MRVINDNPLTRLGRALPALLIGGILTALTGACAAAPPQSLSSGLDPDRLARLDAALESYVQSGTLPGAVALVTPVEGRPRTSRPSVTATGRPEIRSKSMTFSGSLPRPRRS